MVKISKKQTNKHMNVQDKSSENQPKQMVPENRCKNNAVTGEWLSCWKSPPKCIINIAVFLIKKDRLLVDPE